MLPANVRRDSARKFWGSMTTEQLGRKSRYRDPCSTTEQQRQNKDDICWSHTKDGRWPNTRRVRHLSLQSVFSGQQRAIFVFVDSSPITSWQVLTFGQSATIEAT